MDTVEHLQPGDLCEIIEGGYIMPPFRYVIGRTVVLITVDPLDGNWAPYWRCSGVPSNWAVSHKLLRKIPPEQMIEARTHMTDETNDEELTV
jgi:hypothetical protein